MTFGLYITHPQVRIDANVPVPQWGLSDIGRQRAEKAAMLPWAQKLGRIISSDETKAIETAEILAASNDVPIMIAPDTHEKAADAQSRIVSAFDRILSDHNPDMPIAFVGHGGVGTLLKCHLRQMPISRSQDQPGGGGNLFCFSLADRTVSCDWTPIETWQGE